MFNDAIEAAPHTVSLEAGCEMFCSVSSEDNVISGMGVGRTGSGGCMEAEGMGAAGPGAGKEAAGMEAEGGNDIIVTQDEKCSVSQARFSSSESFWDRVAPDSQELKRSSNSMRVAAVLWLRNCFSGQFLTIMPYF